MQLTQICKISVLALAKKKKIVHITRLSKCCMGRDRWRQTATETLRALEESLEQEINTQSRTRFCSDL